MGFTPAQEARAAANPLLARVLVRDACDVIWDREVDTPPVELFGELPYGALVHVNARYVPRFIDEIMPKLRGPIVLHSGFETVTTRYEGFERIIECPLILHWYLEHFELDRQHLSRVTPLPIGLDIHKLTPRPGSNHGFNLGIPASPANQQLSLEAIRETIPPIAERPLKAYANFHLNMDTFLRSSEAKKRRPARLEAMRKLKGKDYTFFEPKQRARHAVWARHREFAFEISPRGNGIDCHRTWEALILKTIPIVRTSRIDPIYDGLPVAIVNDWDEVTPARMKHWMETFRVQIEGPIPAALYTKYWTGAMRAHAKNRK
jgi:hypothetical protein